MWNKCIEIYELDPAHFLSAPGLAWQATLQKTKVERELFSDIDKQLMVKKVLEMEYVALFMDTPKLTKIHKRLWCKQRITIS